MLIHNLIIFHSSTLLSKVEIDFDVQSFTASPMTAWCYWSVFRAPSTHQETIFILDVSVSTSICDVLYDKCCDVIICDSGTGK